MNRLPLFLAATAGTGGGVARGRGDLPGGNGRIAYAASGADVEQGDSGSSFDLLQTIDSDSKRDRFVAGCQRTDGTPTAGNCDISYRIPVWSPNGPRLAFDAGDSLALISPSGKGLKVLRPASEGDGQPAFSPSGTQLAFTATVGSRRDTGWSRPTARGVAGWSATAARLTGPCAG